jgi:hypothetical protein
VPDPLPCYFNLQQVGVEMPFLGSDLEAHPAPLLVIASGRDHDKHPWGEGPSCVGRQLPSHRVRIDTSPRWSSSSTRWGFTLCRPLPTLASCRGVDPCLLIGVGLLCL